MQLRTAGTIAFPVPLVVLAGVLMTLVGLALLGFVMMRPVERTPDPMEIVGNGDLRPVLALLPANSDGSRIAFADREVSQGQFFRGVGTVDPAIAVQSLSSSNCPAPLDPVMPVTCVLPREAALYAERLTQLTNRFLAPEAQLTSCYSVTDETVAWTDRNCTGFRLPTLAEWRRAAGAGLTRRFAGTDDDRQLCDYARVSGCPQADGPGVPAEARRPNAWYLYDMSGNVAEIVYADGERAGGGWSMAGGAWGSRTSIAAPAPRLNGREPSVGFRVVRTVPAGEQPPLEAAPAT